MPRKTPDEHNRVRSMASDLARYEEEIEKLKVNKGGNGPVKVNVKVDSKNVALAFDPKSGTLDNLASSTRDVLERPVNQEWMRHVRRHYGPLDRMVYRDGEFKPGEIQKAAESLTARVGELKQDGRHEEAAEVAEAVEYLKLLNNKIPKLRGEAFASSYTRLDDKVTKTRREIIDRSKLDEPAEADLRAMQEAIDDLDEDVKTLEKKAESVGIKKSEEHRLAALRRDLNDMRNARKQAVQKATKNKAARDQAAREAANRLKEAERSNGQRAENIAELRRMEQDARIILDDPDASAFEKRRARRILANAAKTEVDLVSAGAFQQGTERKRREIERIRGAMEDAEPEERAFYQRRIQDLREEVREREKTLKQAREDGKLRGLGARDEKEPGFFGRFLDQTSERRMERRLAKRQRQVARQRAAESTSKALDKVRKHEAFTATTDAVSDFAKTTGFGMLWKAEAYRIRRQRDNAIQAQRVARSSLWKWWYTFSEPVRRVLIFTMLFAPLMVPVGIVQVGGWAVFAIVAFMINVSGAAIIEFANLIFFGFLSIINLAGNSVQAFIEQAGRGFMVSLGMCETTAECAYNRLPFDFAVEGLPVPPLIDAAKHYPTIFNNNSLLSTGFDLLGLLPWPAVAAIGTIAALFVPIMLMSERSPAARLAVFGILGALTIAGVFTHLFLDNNFYHIAADIFRTGTGRTFEGLYEAIRPEEVAAA